jgi:uncharacterized protein
MTAPALRHLHVEDYRVMPWKNGLGTTTEVGIEPPGADLDSFRWRVSIADVTASGPFSRFAGCDRIIVQLDGEPMTIVHEGRGVFGLSPVAPHYFAGEEATRVELTSTARDFNVIVRRDRACAEVAAHHLARGVTLDVGPKSATVLIYLVRGMARVATQGATAGLSPGETCVVEGVASLAVTAEDDHTTALVVRITGR